MKHALATACTVFTLSLAGAAFADSVITAKLQTPQTGHTKLIAASAVWNCEGDTCVAAIAPDDATGVSGCKELARQVGPLAAYTPDSRALSTAAIARCNTVAKVPANIGTASAAR